MKFNFLKRANIITLVAVMLMSVGVSCASNVLSAVQINPVGDSYQIVLKTTNPAELKKVIKSQNKMYLELKDVKISPSVNTIYNNVLNVDNVVIEPTMNKGVKITFDGENISTGKIKFENVKPLKSLNSVDEIQINQPINSYAPVYSEPEEDVSVSSGSVLSKASALFVRAKNSKKVRNALKKTFSGKYIICFGALLLIAGVGARAFKGNDDNAKVGLQNLKESNLDTVTADLRSNLNTIRSKEANSLKTDYGMKAYQQSQRNPYTSAPIRHSAGVPISKSNKKISQKPAPKFYSQLAKEKAGSSLQENPLHSAVAEIVNKQPKPLTQNVDSIKFLESMSKIYEKNGRSDLAKGLKENMKKAQFATT